MAKLCKNCGYTGNPKNVTKGSCLIEVILWFTFLVPGLIYSIWRLTSRDLVCPKCGAPNMIPTSMPVAQQTLQQNIPPPPLSKQSTAKLYRIAKDGQDLGEYSFLHIQNMISSGQLTLQDYYFDISTNSWVPLSSLINTQTA